MPFFLFTAFLILGILGSYQESSWLSLAFVGLLILCAASLNYHASDALNLSW